MSVTQNQKRKSDDVASPLGREPAPKKLKISQAQKRALIDNLQLEVTERARHLRAHYALQCADLQARIERRINRIPLSLRKANLGELYGKQVTAASATKQTAPASRLQNPVQGLQRPLIAAEPHRPLPPVPQGHSSKPSSPDRLHNAPTASARSRKRKTEDIIIASDKENEPAEDTLAMSKNPKRPKTTATRQVSKTTTDPANVLSPRSHNSRTLRRSPIKETAIPSSPNKPSQIARPVSPLKPASPFKSAASAATSAITASIHGMVEHAKRGTANTAGKLTRTTSREKNTTTASVAPTKGKMLPPPRPAAAPVPERTVSQSSTHSATSTASGSSSSTTVVKKASSATLKKTATSTAAVKKPAAATTAAAGAAATASASALKKTAGAGANKKVVVAEPAAGRRVLRKRN